MQEIELKIKNKETKEEQSILFEIPLKWEELTLRQFIDWYETTLEEDLTDISRMIKLVCILSGKSLEEIEKLPEKGFFELVKILNPLIEKGFPPLDLKKEELPEGDFEAEIAGKKYRWKPDYFKDSIGNIARMEQMLTGLNLVSHFHYVLAFCMNYEGEEFDVDKLNEKAQLFLDSVYMDQLYFFLFASFVQGRTSLDFIKGFSQGERAVNRMGRELQFLQNSGEDGVGMITESK